MVITHVIEAGYIRDYMIKLRFEDGSVKIVDLEPYTKRGGVFSMFSDKEFFKTFFLDLNTLCWPNGADIAPERLYEIGRAVLSNEEVRAPFDRLRVTN